MTIEIRNHTAAVLCAELLPTDRRFELVHADPPWDYKQAAGRGGRMGSEASAQYGTLSEMSILADLRATYELAEDDAYLVLWCTGPKLMEWLRAVVRAEAESAWPWTYVGAGSWGKSGGPGMGWHWRGNSEPVLLYKKGAARPKTRRAIGNAWWEPRTSHSEKPQAILRDLLRLTTTSGGGGVIELYAGNSGSMPRACTALGRNYLGCEVASSRYEEALQRLGQMRAPRLPPKPEGPGVRHVVPIDEQVPQGATWQLDDGRYGRCIGTSAQGGSLIEPF